VKAVDFVNALEALESSALGVLREAMECETIGGIGCVPLRCGSR